MNAETLTALFFVLLAAIPLCAAVFLVQDDTSVQEWRQRMEIARSAQQPPRSGVDAKADRDFLIRIMQELRALLDRTALSNSERERAIALISNIEVWEGTTVPVPLIGELVEICRRYPEDIVLVGFVLLAASLL